MHQQRKDNNARFDKWVQTLAIPITLAAFSRIITWQDSITEMFNMISVILGGHLFMVLLLDAEVMHGFWKNEDNRDCIK